MRIFEVWAAAIIFIGFASLPAAAGSFDGWCFMQDECYGPSKIRNDSYGTCEENCILTNATPIRGMDARLYDVSCTADHGNRTERIMLMRYSDVDGKRRVIAVDKFGSQELKRCKQ